MVVQSVISELKRIVVVIAKFFFTAQLCNRTPLVSLSQAETPNACSHFLFSDSSGGVKSLVVMGVSTHYLLHGSVVYCVDSLFEVFWTLCIVIYSAFSEGWGQRLVLSRIFFSLKDMSSLWIHRYWIWSYDGLAAIYIWTDVQAKQKLAFLFWSLATLEILLIMT